MGARSRGVRVTFGEVERDRDFDFDVDIDLEGGSGKSSNSMANDLTDSASGPASGPASDPDPETDTLFRSSPHEVKSSSRAETRSTSESGDRLFWGVDVEGLELLRSRIGNAGASC